MFDHASSSGHPLMQDAAFGRALARCGQHVAYLPGGHLLLARRFCGVPVAMLPRALPPADLALQLRDIGWHRRPLILSPEEPCALPRALPLAAPRARALWDLSTDRETRRAALHRKWRNHLRHAERQALKVTRTQLPPDPRHPLLLADARQAKARGYANWPAPLTAAFAAAAPKQTLLIEASFRGESIAWVLFLRHGDRASYHIGHITAQGKTLCAHNLLLWRGADALAALGCRSLDLGLLHPATPGLNHFKLRTGAAALETGGTHLYWRPF